VLTIVSLLGQIAILAYASIAALKKNTIPDGVFYICAALIFVAFVLIFFGVKEPAAAPVVAHAEEKIPFRVYVRDLRQFGEAQKCLVSIFFLWTGLNAILSYLTLYTTHVFRVSDSKALQISILLIVSSLAAAYPFGRLGQRYGKRPMIVLGTSGMIVAAIGFLGQVGCICALRPLC